MSVEAIKSTLESRTEFDQNPEGQYEYWLTELEASEKMLKAWREQGTRIVQRFRGGSMRTSDQHSPDARGGPFRLNLFHSNVVTLQSILYGNLPKVNVNRRHNDPNDDVGRVAADIMERMLNSDVQDNGKEYTSILRAVLQDRLLPGLGCARVRYTVQTSTDPTTGEKIMVGEDAPIDYYHWRDVLWGWSRTWANIPWVAFRSYLKKDTVAARFGEDVAELVKLDSQRSTENRKSELTDEEEEGPWKRAEIWEIWDKATKKICWINPGYDKILDMKPDTLKLSGFFPCPPFMLANQTTHLYIPTSDYSLAQDLYNEIDTLQTRISVLTEAVKVVGVYDRSADGLQRMFKEGTDNALIPVDNWALFAEKGGISGQVDWVPIVDIVAALEKLQQLRDETIGLLQQVTGMSDIMRGQLQGQYEGVGQSQLKAKFGSVRIQALQDEFAQFASDLLQLKAEVISRHFSFDTIINAANCESMHDQALLRPALELVKNPAQSKLKVEIRPESVAMVDYAQLKQERVEYITAVSTFLQSSGAILEKEPTAKPFLLQLLQWGLAGFKGSKSIEGVLDKAIVLSTQEQQNSRPPPNPEIIKQQGAMKLEAMKHKNQMQQFQAKAQSDAAIRNADLQADMQTNQSELRNELERMKADLFADISKIKAKMFADLKTTEADAETNIAQTQVDGQVEMEKGVLDYELEMDKERAKTAQEITKIRAQTAGKVEEAKAKPKPRSDET